MKKFLTIIVIVILIMNLVSCEGNFEYYDTSKMNENLTQSSSQNVRTNIDYNIDYNGSRILDIAINVVEMNDVENEKVYQSLQYPELSCSNNDYANTMLSELTEKLKKEVTSFRDENKDTVREMVNTETEDDYFKDLMFMYTKDAEVVTNDGKYLSLLITTFMDAGGAHPNYLMNGYTYDIINEEETDLYDFIKDKEELRRFLKDYVAEHKDELYEDADITIDNYIDNPPNEYGIDYHIDYYIQNQQFHIVFQTYELAPHAAGIIDIIVNDDLLKVNLEFDK